MREPTRTKLGSFKPRRLITGLWQMADQERDGKPFDLEAAAEALVSYARAGFDSFDMADHYGSAEIVAGMASKALREAGETPPLILTKWCPEPGPMDLGRVREGVERALRRLDMDRVDVMQFHWWRYEMPEYIDAIDGLSRLREEGLIGEIGLTNFDAAHLHLLLRNGFPIASNQVCFSMLDRRAAGDLSRVAQENDVTLLAFGTLAGGFLSNRWQGADEPDEIADWSRMKYKRFVDAVGGWGKFQGLLGVLGDLAAKHDCSISNIASAWVLDHDAVGATIIGARLGENQHRQDNLSALDVEFDDEDRNRMSSALMTLGDIPGDCGDEYRRPPFLTASGDLSHHLDQMPAVFPVVEMRNGRARVDTGSIWEKKAGFARAIREGDRILVSGTTATAPNGDAICESDAEGQAIYILDKIIASVEALGGTVEDIARTRVYLRHKSDWEVVSRVHARYFEGVRPANTLIGGMDLVGPYDVEIEAEAILPTKGKD